MLLACHRFPAIAAVLLLLSLAPRRITSSTITAAPQASPPPANLTATCEFRTINYITDSLPQLCFRSSWSSINVTPSTKGTENATAVSERVEATAVAASSSFNVVQESPSGNTTSYEGTPEQSSTVTQDLHLEGRETGTPSADTLSELSELNESSFLSFEEWKKKALEKAGQASSNIGNRKSGQGENRRKDPESIQNSLDSVGDEGEIDLDFSAFRDSDKSHEASRNLENIRTEIEDEPQALEQTEKREHHYRSKDAGITCKERFSYASFDAGATVLKTHPGAKNPKAILIENKDSYMLSECSSENKFIIIELSEDIWIDTVVLANYEFFSSMVRAFRVSVSDRYPVKMEKWKDAGTYEARNSRDIQAFLVENPQIWARYVRIEFLSHYGNEYYCPLSLVRVHGTRMLESWKESEATGEDDDAGDGERDIAGEHFVPDAVAEVVQAEEKLNAELKAQASTIVKDSQDFTHDRSKIAAEDALEEQKTTPWPKLIVPMMLQDLFEDPEVCLPAEAPVLTTHATPSISTQVALPADASQSSDAPTSLPPAPSTSPSTTTQPDSIPLPVNETLQTTHTMPPAESNSSMSTTTGYVSVPLPSPALSQANGIQNATTTNKNKTTTTSSTASALPTIQESFFKAVSRRLQLLEANSTLSLKYIEEQSKILREAFSKVEKKQLQKSSSFLDTLNSTVLVELRGFRQQYDEIWQSTIISLESQREESRKEIVAISSRLNILADEVVFQKRMSIVQSVLLLLCLGLVIFSRVSAGGMLEASSMHSRARISPDYAIESPLQSPPDSPNYHHRSWLEPSRRIRQSDASGISASRSRGGDSPPTPKSSPSQSDASITSPSDTDDIPIRQLDHRHDNLEPQLRDHYKPRTRSSTFEGPSSTHTAHLLRCRPRSRSYETTSSHVPTRGPQNSPTRTQTRDNFSTEQTSPPIAGADDFQDITTLSDIWPSAEYQIGSLDGFSRPRSPADIHAKPSFNTVRKPLPALPANFE